MDGQHVRNVVRGFFYQLLQHLEVLHTLTIDTRRTFSYSLTTRINYYNAVRIRRIDTMSPTAARLVVGAGKFDHV